MSKEAQKVAKIRKTLQDWLQIRKATNAQGYTPAELAMREHLHQLLAEIQGSEANFPADPENLAKLYLMNSVPSPQAQGILPLLIIAGGAIYFLLGIVDTWSEKALEERKIEACKADPNSPYCPTDWGKIALIGGLALGGLYAYHKGWFKRLLKK